MVSLRADGGKPADGKLPVVQTAVEAMRAEMTVEQVGQPSAIRNADDQRNIVHALILNGKCLCRASSIVENAAFGQSIHAKLEQ